MWNNTCFTFEYTINICAFFETWIILTAIGPFCLYIMISLYVVNKIELRTKRQRYTISYVISYNTLHSCDPDVSVATLTEIALCVAMRSDGGINCCFNRF